MSLVRLACVALLAATVLRPAPARAEIGAYLLFDMADGSIIAEHEATAIWYPASVTKLMTAYVTFEAIAAGELKLTSPVRISPQANQQPPSRMGFPVGTVLTVETALRILMTKSANDVSVALAQAVGGTLTGFIERMNAAAAKLGMTATHYDNPHGLPNTGQLTTARDIAVLMMALAREYPNRDGFFSMNSVRLGSQTIVNFNALLRRFAGADGMKTGFICASGFNIAATATRDGRRLGAVVLGGLTSQERDERTAELLEKGFEAAASGGTVALDGFNRPDGRLDVRPVVAGGQPDRGTVAALENPAETDATDRRDEVCGASRPITRYSDGTVTTLAEVETQRAGVAAYRLLLASRRSLVEAVLSAPRPAPVRPSVPLRAPADDALVPAGWMPSSRALLPAVHPVRGGDVSTAGAAGEGATVPAAEAGETAAAAVAEPAGDARSPAPTAAAAAAAAPDVPPAGADAADAAEAAAPGDEGAPSAAADEPAGATPPGDTLRGSSVPGASVPFGAQFAAVAQGGSSPPTASPADGVSAGQPATVTEGGTEQVSDAGTAQEPGTSLAPPGWIAAPAVPIANPLETADLREPIPRPEAERPLTYLGAREPLRPVPIALGGADPERPDPLSGTVVGGGPPPVPSPRPMPAPAEAAAPAPGEDVT